MSVLLANVYNYNASLYIDYMAKSDYGDFVKVLRASSQYQSLKFCTRKPTVS